MAHFTLILVRSNAEKAIWVMVPRHARCMDGSNMVIAWVRSLLLFFVSLIFLIGSAMFVCSDATCVQFFLLLLAPVCRCSCLRMPRFLAAISLWTSLPGAIELQHMNWPSIASRRAARWYLTHSMTTVMLSSTHSVSLVVSNFSFLEQFTPSLHTRWMPMDLCLHYLQTIWPFQIVCHFMASSFFYLSLCPSLLIQCILSCIEFLAVVFFVLKTRYWLWMANWIIFAI